MNPKMYKVYFVKKGETFNLFSLSHPSRLPSATDLLWTCWFIAFTLKLVTCILLSCVLFV